MSKTENTDSTEQYEIPIGKERELIKWAVSLYEPNYLSLLTKLDGGEIILITKDKNDTLIKLALVNLFRKNLTMKELDFMYCTILLLPKWLQPYV